MARLSPDEVEAWLVASCAVQGVQVKVDDALVVARVRVLMGGEGAGAAGKRSAAGDDARTA